MSVFFSPVWIDLSDDSCGTMLMFCTEPGDHVTAPAGVAPDGFRWYEQDSGDDLADEILAWAAAEEAALPLTDALPAGDF